MVLRSSTYTHIFVRYLLLVRSDFDFLLDRQDGWELSTALSICFPLVIVDFRGDLGSVSLVVRFEYAILEPQVFQFALQIIQLSHRVGVYVRPVDVALYIVDIWMRVLFPQRKIIPHSSLIRD